MEIKTKTITILLTIIMLTIVQTAQAAECNGSGITKLITYSPSDLNVGEAFNLTYYDLFGGAGQLATLNYPATITRLSASDTVTLIDDGFGGSYFTWHMNSSTPGNHTVYVNISYEGSCEVSRIITIQPTLYPPQLQLSYIMTLDPAIAKQNKVISLIINNVGTGTAYNVSGWTNFISVIDTFLYPLIEAGNITMRNFNINTAYCSLAIPLDSTANYQDVFGYQYPPSHTGASIKVLGSDLEIQEFEISNNKPKKDQTVDLTVKVKNNAKSETINASNAILKIYKDDELIKELDLGSITVGSSIIETVNWKVSGSTGETTLKAVVDSSNECNNWNNNEKKLVIEIKKKTAPAEDEEEIPAEETEEERAAYFYPETPTPTADEEKISLSWLIYPALIIISAALVLAIIYLIRRIK